MVASRTSLVEVHARQLGEERRIWGGLGWRNIRRVVSDIGADPDYEDIETGIIRAGGKSWHVWRRHGSTWITNREVATRYATLNSTKE